MIDVVQILVSGLSSEKIDASETARRKQLAESLQRFE